jgi:ABC-type transporter Mla MlaB component
MSTPTKNGALVLRLDSLNKDNAAARAEAIVAALGQAAGVLRIELSGLEGPDAAGLAVLIAASNEARSRSLELQLGLPKELSELAEDLRLGKLAVVESLEVLP